MVLSIIDSVGYNSSSSNTVTLDYSAISYNSGDIAIAVDSCYSTSGAATTYDNYSEGWTLLGSQRTIGSDLGYNSVNIKILTGSETGIFENIFSSTVQRSGNLVIVRDSSLDRSSVANLVDDMSNSDYEVSDTIVRAGSVTITSDNAVAIYIGLNAYSVTTNVITPPTGFTTIRNTGGPASDIYTNISYKESMSSGATGNLDGSITNAVTGKHGYLLVLNPGEISTNNILPPMIGSSF